MTVTFDLLNERWIPCVNTKGSVEHFGLMECLTRAEQLTEIHDASPLVTVALHRLLLAILHRVFGPESDDAWASLWKSGNGKFDSGALEKYLTAPKISSRFDLFDAKHPFYQTPSLPLGEIQPKTGRPKFVKPIWQLAHELAYSDSMRLFAHFTENDWDVRPAAEAARWLVAFQSYALAGLITVAPGEDRKTEGSVDGGQLIKSAVVLAKGNNLFQTLMLNFVHYSAEDEAPFEFRASKDKTAWERDDETRPMDRRFDGYLDLLTWQSRRVKLIPETDEKGRLLGVYGVVAMKGFQLPDFLRHDSETMVGFIKSENAKPGTDPWPPLGFSFGKELWRDCHALMQSAADRSKQPRNTEWIGDLRQRGRLDWKQMQIEVAGLCSDRAKIFFWRHESLPLPLAYLKEASLIENLKTALALAESVSGEALRPAAWAAAAKWLSPGPDSKPDTDRVRDVVDSFAPERLYWSRLERPFRELLIDLAETPDAEGRAARVCEWYWKVLHRAAVSAFDQSIGRIDGGRDLKAVNAGRGLLMHRLKSIRTNNRILERQRQVSRE